MRRSGLIHLHNHSKYSILDGVITPQLLLPRLEELGMDAFAVTDHGTLSSIPEFVRAADKQNKGLKIIAGCEFYEVDDIAHKTAEEAHDSAGMSCEAEHKTLAQQRAESVDVYAKENPRYWHITMLARNYDGYKKLLRLTAQAATPAAYYYKPRIDRAMLADVAGGDIMVGTGCAGSRLSQYALRYDDYQGWSDRIDMYLRWFGADNVFCEIMANGFDGQHVINDKIIQWAARKGVQVAVTSDAHYVERSHARLQDVMLCVATNQRVDAPDRKFTFEGDHYYVRSEQEVLDAFAAQYGIDATPYTAATQDIAARCEHAGYVMDFQFRLPQFDYRRADLEGFQRWVAARHDKLATRYPEDIIKEALQDACQ